jgi:outer membrane receptor for ferrienterochelin and colicins
VVAVALLAGGAPDLARADEAAMARFHHEQAGRHYAAGRFESAIEHFFNAQRLSPNPRTIYNIGLCFFQLRRYPDAFHFLSEYLDASDEADGVEGRRALAQRTVRQILPRVARVRVESTPPGARIFVDRQEYGVWGETPRVLAVEPGERHIWVELEGHEPAERMVTAEQGAEAGLVLELEPILGRVEVTAVEGASVRLMNARGNTVAAGKAPLRTGVPPGRYEVEVTADGFHPQRRLLTVTADQPTEARIRLERLPPPTGSLAITANVSQAVVEIDGEPAGFTPLALAGLEVERKRIQVTAPDHIPWEGEVNMRPDRQTWVRATLAHEPRGRSPLTWVFGGLGAAALSAGAITGGFALARHNEFESAQGTLAAGDLRGDRRRGRALNVATDVLLITGLVSLAVGVVLFFITNDQDAGRSSVVVSGGSE